MGERFLPVETGNIQQFWHIASSPAAGSFRAWHQERLAGQAIGGSVSAFTVFQ